jgi:hypothetical protein
LLLRGMGLARISEARYFSLSCWGGAILPVNLRQFAPLTAALDEAWCSCACSGDTWTPSGYQWGTENGPIKVANAAGVSGVQKPGKVGVSNAHTPATEKIVADLARVLGLPVPPITLYDRGAAAGDPRYVAISAWAFDAPVTWGQAEPLLSPGQKASLLPVASAMMPFELWIGASDRQNAGNVLIDGALGMTLKGAWIDYAFALDHVWKGNLHPPGGVQPLYPPIGAVDAAVAKTVAQDIVKVDDAVIDEIVNRIAAEYLPQPVAANIVRNLVARKPQVSATFT